MKILRSNPRGNNYGLLANNKFSGFQAFGHKIV